MSTRTTPRRRRPAMAAGVAVLSTALLSSCGMAQLSLVSNAVGISSSAAAIAVSPALGTQDASPATPINVSVTSGRITDVTVTTADGKAVVGTVGPDGRTWVSRTSNLGYGETYQVSVAAVDREGIATTTKDSFRTLEPSETARTYISPVASSVVGVGMPITVQFDHKVKRKADVERSLKVVTAKPIEGAWHWLDDKLVEYRPKTYWPANTEITVKSRLVGVELSKGVWGQKNRSITFRTGAAMVSTVDMNSHELTVRKNGKVIRTIPITTGKPGFDTRSGVKVIMSKERNRIMDASTGGTSQGDPEYYRLNVEYAMRLTWSGEFLHAAPWSVGSQGSANVSHGCTGMSTGNAAWLYGISIPGDVVEYVGNDKMMEFDNGIGAWTLSWEKWKAGSALAAKA